MGLGCRRPPPVRGSGELLVVSHHSIERWRCGSRATVHPASGTGLRRMAYLCAYTLLRDSSRGPAIALLSSEFSIPLPHHVSRRLFQFRAVLITGRGTKWTSHEASVACHRLPIWPALLGRILWEGVISVVTPQRALMASFHVPNEKLYSSLLSQLNTIFTHYHLSV